MNKNALLIGAGGFLGSSILPSVSKIHEKIFAFSYDYPNGFQQINNVEYITGDVNNRELLASVLSDVSTVYYFLSSTVPASSNKSLSLEINRTLSTLVSVLDCMVENSVPNIIFPSSG